CDILPEVHYNYEHRLFPLARCRIESDGERLLSCETLDDPFATEYETPPLRVAELQGDCILGGRYPRLRSLTYTFEERSITWEDGPERDLLISFSDCLRQTDPDLIWTSGGDDALMPALFGLAARHRVHLALDREPNLERQLVMDGRSYVSYGRVLYQSPDYPLFGRWHLDRRNTFLGAESGLDGLIEVARLSKIPLQRIARRSIGTGISSIQLDWAYRNQFLIPWKKSRPEDWKSASALLRSDRGGLTYQPITGVYENVVELDFASMYPSIMVNRNVSPETVNCRCCAPNRAVPELEYTICEKRKGLVPHSIDPIIRKREEYKRLRRRAREAGDEALYRRYDGRQCALKWLLVCCFGYLGYRNARFGRIEAHES
ncbi:MAG: DNA polymerase domain-containing protein, partial [Gammaproteobacteria bacterium]